jgi:trimethylamine:corrinoid methyltransferase-like protein
MQLTVLSQDEVRAIHQVTLRMLSEVGVFPDDEARTLLFDHSARQHQCRVLDDIVQAMVSAQAEMT